MDETIRTVSFADIVSEAGVLLRRHFKLTAGLMVGIAAVYSVLDFTSFGVFANFALALTFSIFGQYHYIEHLLTDRMARADADQGRPYGAIFTSSLLSGLGIAIGVLLLVVPGIVLLSRWAISSPYVVAHGYSGMRSLEASWDATALSKMTMFFVYLIYCVAFVAALAMAGGATFLSGDADAPIVIVATNFVSSFSMIAGWLLATAAYRQLTGHEPSLRDVFD